MAYSSGYQVRFGPRSVSGAVKSLLLINAAVFVLQTFSHLAFQSAWMEYLFALTPPQINQFFIWQFVTYSFLHGSFFHILFNMLALWMFGSEIEERLSSASFLKLYFSSVIMGGLLTYLADMGGFHQGTVLGASGGVFGLLIAYAMIWPNREILFMMIFPLKSKYFVLILMLMIVFAQGGSNIAHLAHFGGAAGGFLYIYYSSRLYRPSGWSVDSYFRKRRAARAQKEWNERIHAKERVDEILEKISRNGMNSLSRDEKNFLKRASSSYYKDET